MSLILPPHPLKKLYDSLEITSTGEIRNVPQKLSPLKEGNYTGSKLDFEGKSIQLSVYLCPKKDSHFRSSHQLRILDQDLWRLYTGSHSYYYDSEGNLI